MIIIVIITISFVTADGLFGLRHTWNRWTSWNAKTDRWRWSPRPRWCRRPSWRPPRHPCSRPACCPACTWTACSTINYSSGRPRPHSMVPPAPPPRRSGHRLTGSGRWCSNTTRPHNSTRLPPRPPPLSSRPPPPPPLSPPPPPVPSLPPRPTLTLPPVRPLRRRLPAPRPPPRRRSSRRRLPPRTIWTIERDRFRPPTRAAAPQLGWSFSRHYKIKIKVPNNGFRVNFEYAMNYIDEFWGL